MLDGVVVVPRLVIPDYRGKVQRVWREEEQLVRGHEVYVSTVYPGIIKGWHGYYSKEIFYTVVKGMVKLVLYDDRPDSDTYADYQELYIGERNPVSVKIPHGIMNAFQGLGMEESVVVVVASEVFNENTTIRWNIEDLDYDWRSK